MQDPTLRDLMGDLEGIRVKVKLSLRENTIWKRGGDFWKFNFKLLKDADYISEINAELKTSAEMSSSFDNKDSFFKSKLD